MKKMSELKALLEVFEGRMSFKDWKVSRRYRKPTSDEETKVALGELIRLVVSIGERVLKIEKRLQALEEHEHQ